MLRTRLTSPLVSATTIFAIAAGGVAVMAPAATAAPQQAAHTQGAHSKVAKRSCDTDASVTAARKAVKKAKKANAHRAAKVFRAKKTLAKKLVRSGAVCLDSTSFDDLIAMLPDELATQVQGVLDQIETVFTTYADAIPGADVDELSQIIANLTSLDPNQIVSTLTDLADQLSATGGDPDAISGVLSTVLAGLPDGVDDDATIGDLGSSFSDLLDALQGVDFADAASQIQGHLSAINDILSGLLDQVVAAVPQLQVLVDLFDQLGFGDLSGTQSTSTAATHGFGSILSGLLGSTGSIDGIGSLLGSGHGLMSMVSNLFSSGSGLFGSLFGGLFGGSGTSGLSSLFGGFSGGSGSGGGILGNLFGGGGLFGRTAA